MNLKWIWIALLLSHTSAQAVTNLAESYQVLDPGRIYLKQVRANPELVIDHVNQAGFEVYGPVGLGIYLASLGIVTLPPQRVVDANAADYPTAEAVSTNLQNLAKQFPELITLTEIGKSVEGRPLIFARISAPASLGKPLAQRPEFKYIANMHGDEIVGRELMMKLIEDLSSHYGKEERITSLLNQVQVYILPSMNPDGATHRVRYNAKGTDLNRSFPDFTTNDNQNTLGTRDPEIQAVMKFQAAHHFKLSANFHGGAQVVNYPWDTQADPFPLDNLVQKLSLDYASKVPSIANSSEFKNGITNGYSWYEVDGGMQDWSYYWYKDLQLTIELTNTKWPKYSSVEPSYQENRNALLTLIEDTLQF